MTTGMRKDSLVLLLLLVLPSVTGVSGCAWSVRAGGAGTVRDLSELGAEAHASVSAGRSCGRGLCSAGVRADGGFFGRRPAGTAAGSLEYLWFFGANAASVAVSWGPRLVGEETGHVVSLHLTAWEPFPPGRPAGSLGAGVTAGWGFGDEAVRGGWFGVGLYWEFMDLFSRK
jgi:hypothetical protein